jgi:hypothetical protein
MNYTVDGSIGTQPTKVVFGDISSSDVAMDVPESWRDHNVIHYLVKLREAQAILIRVTQDCLKRNEAEDNTGGVHVQNESELTVCQFVLSQDPNRPPNKLSGLYRGPLVITAIECPDMIKVKDLITYLVDFVNFDTLRI